MASIDTYRNSLRSPARALWSGKFSYDQFVAAFDLAIAQGIAQAFKEGSAECHITPDEYTLQEYTELARFIAAQQAYVGGLADWIVNNRRSLGGKLTVIFSRIEKWLAAYDQAKAKANALACGDVKKNSGWARQKSTARLASG